MKVKFFASAVVLLAVISFSARSYAGSLNPSGPPSATGYTLSDIAARISSGTAASGHSLYPTAGPGPTMVTLTQIYDALPSGTTTSASVGDVISGKTFITRGNGVMAFSTGTFTAHELPDTGQTAVYVTNDDGTYQPSASLPSYTMYNYTGGSLVETSDVNVSFVTVDNRTGLMWATDAALVASSTWTVAITNCENLSYAGYTDWRLPNVKELMSIVNYQNVALSISTTTFRNTMISYYWSSTTYADVTTLAWFVDFGGGSVYYYDKPNVYYVRPVRGGP
ncbi:MAG: DUF1566 domain-containing protein [Elusimicrobiota bacterium]